ncbi:hypothetical protein [Aeromicrobium sp. 179-A 4D2 NHS]|uniref:hypothetical protein n=1 Tax=Aeromicrobium sp. 179-A 4D2 NHS TaxID=3142375 RepID=UPI0039A20B8D
MTTTGKNGKQVNASKGVQGFHETKRGEASSGKTLPQSALTNSGLTPEQEDAIEAEARLVIDTVGYLDEMSQRGINRHGEWLKKEIAKPVEEMSTDGIAEVACKMANYKGAQRVYRTFSKYVNEDGNTTQQALFRVTGMVTNTPSRSTDLAYRAESLSQHEGVLDAFDELSKMVAKQQKNTERIMAGDVDA